MPLNKLENFIKNYEGRILYVNSNDLDATDSITNQGNSLTKPFKTIQRALIESARFSYIVGDNNDSNARTTILVFPGEHVIDNRPGYGIRKTGTALASAVAPNGNITSPASDEFTLTLDSNFDLTQEDNVLYKFNSVNGGCILPRGTSLVGLDLRKTKIRPKYVPNPTDDDVPYSSIFRITGLCYFWQFSIFDALESELAYTNDKLFTTGSGNLSIPTFSHHKLTVFEYADGVNVPSGYDKTDLDMYYAKLSNAFNEGSGRQIPAAQKFPLAPNAFTKERPEWEIVGAFASDPIIISSIVSGDGATPSPVVTVNTLVEHELTVGTPIKIRGANTNDYNISTVVSSVTGDKTFTYTLPFVRNDLPASPGGSATVTIETDTVKGASPYIFNCSLRSVWGMNGMHADGRKAGGFRSMVVAQYTAVSLQKDDRAFVKYDRIARTYSGIPINKVTGSLLSSGSASTDNNRIYHLDQDAIYRTGWETTHVKITNDAILQIVSVFAIGFNRHFVAESGSDASITNSNSNFGQIALVSDGFKKESFSKDNNGYITSVITPKAIKETERNFDWIPIDVGLTTAVGISSHLYLFGFDSEDNLPPNLIQGYRIGGRLNESLYLDLPNGDSRKVKIFMTDNTLGSGSTTISGETSSVKEFVVVEQTSAPLYDTLTIVPDHNLQTGEKVIVISDDGDLPEGLVENREYFIITVDNQKSKIKLASTITNARNGIALKIYKGTNLRVLSRVSDRDAGEFGSPIQFDPNNNNWFVHVEASNELFDAISSLGTVGFEEPRTDVTYFKRIIDDRSIDEKIYKMRYVIPKEAPNAKDPGEGFIIQESSTTAPLINSEFSLGSITVDNYNYGRNNRFISTCSESGGTVTIITEQPHDLNLGDRVLIKNIQSSTNVTGFGVTGFNGDFVVAGTSSDKEFTYSIKDRDGITHNVGDFLGISARDTNIPRFERNDLQSNLYVYRSETVTSYEFGVQDGVYHLYVLSADNSIDTEFTDYNYSQSIVDLYPQLDRDNHDDNPQSAKSFARRSPLGDVVTNDLKKSVTRESLDKSVKKLLGFPIVSSISPISSGIATITTTLEHNFGGIVGYSTLTAGNGYNDGTYYNIKLLNSDDSWNGATAKVVVVGTAVTEIQIQASGSGYNSGQELKIDGFSGATVGVTSSVISSPRNNSIQITGVGTAFDSLLRVIDAPSATEIAVAKTSGDSLIYPNQYLYNIAPSVHISGTVNNQTSGITTITCSSAHGMVAGNKLRVIDNSDNNIGDFLVRETIGIGTVVISGNVDPNANRLLKHGFSANNLTSDLDGENLGSRGTPFFDNESAILLDNLTTDSSSGISTFAIQVNSQYESSVGVGTTTRFPLGSFVQVGNEIMRVASSTLTGSGNNEIVAIRGYMGTQKDAHNKDSLIKKIKPIAIELRRPSILRASGHTFEYLGYGPGNYSTSLPQIQNKTLTEREDFLSQSQEKAAGQVIYTGMNSDGDFFIGNTKYSASSGTQQTFDIPVPTITGQDPSRLSVVFDEVIVKERILVEGGKSKQILSQFDGPVTFNEKLILNDETKVNGDLISRGLILQKNTTESISHTTGSIVTKGGVGIAKNLYVGGFISIAGTATFNDDVRFGAGLLPAFFEGAYIGTSTDAWGEAWIGGIGIATGGVPGGIEDKDRTINAWTGDLILTSQAGIVSVTDRLEVTNDFLVKQHSEFVGVATFKNKLHLLDNDILHFGGGVGDAGDMQMRHDGSNSFIRDTGTGDLFIDSVDGSVNIRVNDNENAIIAKENNEVELYYNNTRKLNTTLTGVNVAGIVTASNGFFPLSNEGAPLGSTALAFSEAHIDEIRIGVSGGAEIDTTSGNLVLDSATGTVNVNDNLDVDGTLNVDSTSQFDGNVNMSSNLTVASVLDVNTRAEIDNVRIDGNTIDITNTNGSLTLRAAGSGTINLHDSNVDIEENLQVDGSTTIDTNLTVKGNTNLGNANSDTVRIIGNIDADGVSDFDNIRLNGNTISATNSSGDININGNGSGHINLNDDVDISSTLDVSGATTLTNTLTVSGNHATTLGGTLTVAGTSTLNGGMTVGGNLSATGNFSYNGNGTFGNQSTDSHTFNGSVDFNHTTNFDGVATFKNHIDLQDNDIIKIGAGDDLQIYHDGSNSYITDSGTGQLLLRGSQVLIQDTSGNSMFVSDGTNAYLYYNNSVRLNTSSSGGTLSGAWNITGNFSAGTNTITATTFTGSLNGNANTSSQVKTTRSNSGAGFFVFADANPSGPTAQTMKTGSHVAYSGGNLVIVGGGAFSGDVTAFVSDMRLKTDIQPLTSALDKTLSLNGFTYKFNETGGNLGFDTEITYPGVSAQEVQKVLPEAVRPAPVDDKYITVQYEKLVPLLIEAIKELNAKVEDLEQKLSDK